MSRISSRHTPALLSQASTDRLTASGELVKQALNASSDVAPEVDLLEEAPGAKELVQALAPASNKDAVVFLTEAQTLLLKTLDLLFHKPSKDAAKVIDDQLSTIASCIQRAVASVEAEPTAPKGLANELRSCVMSSGAPADKDGIKKLSVDPLKVGAIIVYVDRAVALLDAVHLGSTCSAFATAGLHSLRRSKELIPEARRSGVWRNRTLPRIQLAFEARHAQARLEVVSEELERLGASSSLQEDAKRAQSILRDVALHASKGQARQINLADLNTCEILVSHLVSQLSSQPQVDKAICHWIETELKSAPEPKSKTSTPSKFIPQDKNLILALDPDRTNHQCLTHLRDYGASAIRITFEEARAALERLPQGESWGYNKSTSTTWQALMTDNGLKTWECRSFEPLDLEIVANILSKLTGITPKQAAKLERLSRAIVENSHQLKNPPETFEADHKTLIRLLLRKVTKS